MTDTPQALHHAKQQLVGALAEMVERPVIRFTVFGVPRTKKTSNRIVQIKAKGGGRGFTKVLPSEAHERWFAEAMKQAPIIRRQVVQAGFALPLEADVEISALFYRDRLAGDLTGFMQALADFLQEPKVNETGRTTRNGAGVLKDDAQIVSWDGSRLKKDPTLPRIEVEIRITGVTA